MAYRVATHGICARVRTGMGSVSTNPDVPSNPCETQWAWSIPTCWQWPKSLIYGSNYASTPMPPVVGSTLPDGSAIPPVPASGQAASDTVQALTDAQIAATQAGNQTFFENLNPIVNPPAGVPWWVWLAGGVAAFALVATGGGSPRRYAR